MPMQGAIPQGAAFSAMKDVKIPTRIPVKDLLNFDLNSMALKQFSEKWSRKKEKMILRKENWDIEFQADVTQR